jgi:hypothetical protein
MLPLRNKVEIREEKVIPNFSSLLFLPLHFFFLFTSLSASSLFQRKTNKKRQHIPTYSFLYVLEN